MESERLEYRPSGRRGRALARLDLVMLLAPPGLQVALAVARQDWVLVAFWVLFAGGATAITHRLHKRTFVADADGIRAKPRLVAPWSQIEAVIEPTQWDMSVRVRMADGEEKETGFPPENAVRLAEIGRKPLV